MFSLWRKARRENSAASRLLGSTSLRFALHGWQRELVAADLQEVKVKDCGRKGLPVESVLRCAILKQYRQVSY
ncbi:hypothetical protein, partial [Thiolapillus sp.]|uniref:hypothetical protein n=1 Tax=Thiolapillus sp. TaxID=2017437 RepID=UPI003AF7C44E